jgi:endonuclease YncB( thermonuclease family)
MIWNRAIRNKQFSKILLTTAWCLIACTIGVFAQARLSGTVSDVLDGKTFIIETGSAKIKAELQGIEIPKQKAPLYSEVTEHLKKLTIAQVCEFQISRIVGEIAVGNLYVRGINISAQMVRDGAAVINPETPLPDDLYSELERNQQLAKTEKRGIWAIGEDYARKLEAGSFEAEEAEHALSRWASLLGRAANGVPTESVRMRAGASTLRPMVSLWNEAKNQDAENLLADYDRLRKLGFLGSKPVSILFPEARSIHTAQMRAMFLYSGTPALIETGEFALAFMIRADDYRFSSSTLLTINADGVKIPIGTPLRFARPANNSVEEVLIFRISKPTAQKLANSKRLVINLGRYIGSVSAQAQAGLKQVLELGI